MDFEQIIINSSEYSNFKAHFWNVLCKKILAKIIIQKDSILFYFKTDNQTFVLAFFILDSVLILNSKDEKNLIGQELMNLEWTQTNQEKNQRILSFSIFFSDCRDINFKFQYDSPEPKFNICLRKDKLYLQEFMFLPGFETPEDVQHLFGHIVISITFDENSNKTRFHFLVDEKLCTIVLNLDKKIKKEDYVGEQLLGFIPVINDYTAFLMVFSNGKEIFSGMNPYPQNRCLLDINKSIGYKVYDITFNEIDASISIHFFLDNMFTSFSFYLDSPFDMQDLVGQQLVRLTIHPTLKLLHCIYFSGGKRIDIRIHDNYDIILKLEKEISPNFFRLELNDIANTVASNTHYCCLI